MPPDPNATVSSADGLNLRSGPGTEHDVIAAMPDGTRVTVESAAGDWLAVDTPHGRGFVHRDFLTLDPGFQPSDAGSAGTHTVALGETLSVIAARYGLDWRDIAAANALANPDILSVGQVLAIPGWPADGGPPPPVESLHTVAPGESLSTIAARYGLDWQDIAAVNNLANPDVLAVGQVLTIRGGAGGGGAGGTTDISTLIVRDPLTPDGSAIVTSSSAIGHHRPWGGTHSADLDVVGQSQGVEVRLHLECPGRELRGVVNRIGFACRSGRVSDGGHVVHLDIESRIGDGAWARTGAWVLYAHLDPVFVSVGDVVAASQVVGLLGPPSGPEYSSSCATASHVHVEVSSAESVAMVGGACGAAPLMTGRI